jgi:hypothetical protein
MECTMAILLRLLSVIIAILMAGCASKTLAPEEYSGYLSDYSKLVKVDTASGGETLRWVSDKIAAQSYHSVILDKTILYPKPQPTAQVSDTLLRQFTWTVDKALASSVSGSYKIVTKPGEGVLRIKPAITGVVHSMEGIQPLEILPTAMVIGLGKAALGTRDRDVSVFLEVAVMDSQTDELLATVVRNDEGTQLENDEEQLTIVHLEEMIARWKADATDVFSGLSK